MIYRYFCLVFKDMDDLNPKNMDVTCFKGSNKTVNTLSFNDLTEDILHPQIVYQ